MRTEFKKKLKKRSFILTMLLILTVVILTVIPFFLSRDTSFIGTDERAKEAVMEINPHYKPWFSSIVKPLGGEFESLLFSLQAALGAGILGYYLGYLKGCKGKQNGDQL